MAFLIRRLSGRKLQREKPYPDPISSLMLHAQLRPYDSSVNGNFSDSKSNEQMRATMMLEYSLQQLREDLSFLKESEAVQVVLSLLDIHAPLHLIEAFGKVRFESKKDIMFILTFLLRKSAPSCKCSNLNRKSKATSPTNIDLNQSTSNDYTSKVAKYLRENKVAFITKLLHAYSNPDYVLHCGEVIRYCISHKFLHEEILDRFQMFAEILRKHFEHESFEVCSDAFVTLRDILNHNHSLIARFLEKEHEMFCCKYEELLRSESYYTQRQSLSLLNMLLLTPGNYEFRMRYLNNKSNLMLIMNQMGSESRWIRKESYGVFTLFKANPHKSKEVERIFGQNSDKLEAYCASMETNNPLETG
mmetsp:Transcript_6057/g.7284  ORF Transcript_6057/g.7284 Transcript_6057/m.7284 type:complete len:360 (+) Transcript_6057:371-1450(+)